MEAMGGELLIFSPSESRCVALFQITALDSFFNIRPGTAEQLRDGG
jgi:hypothetical protein